MTFFDKKQEVISVELTQYGKYLISKGKFRPAYYDFIDDDILYDSKYGKFEELNSNISNRIRNETPSIKPQYVFSGIETKIKQIAQQLRQGKDLFSNKPTQQMPEKHYFSAAVLGNSDLSSKYFPSWKINLLKGEIDSIKQIKTDLSPSVSVPEITIKNCNFKIKTIKSGQEVELQPDEFISKTFGDKSALRIIGNSLIFEFKEENIPVMYSNFDIEMYIQELDTETNEEKLLPLYFQHKNSSIINNLLVGDGSEEYDLNAPTDPKSVEYYFTVNVDSEIPDDIKQKLSDDKQTELQIIPTNNNVIKSSK